MPKARTRRRDATSKARLVPSDAAIVWLGKTKRCQRCQKSLYSPGLVGRAGGRHLCWECLTKAAPALGWLLWLAQALRLSYGTVPGAREMS